MSLTDIAAQLLEKANQLSIENAELRELLFFHHGCSGPTLYGDDGELQCSACGIDFKRDAAKTIRWQWVQRSLREAAMKASCP